MLFLFTLVALVSSISLLGYEIPQDVELSTQLYQSQCAHKALEVVIEHCASGGVESLSSSLKKKSAVMLSLCEFQDSAIDYPLSCKKLHSDEDYHECVQDLRSTSQFWTTYSGNYRRIKSICHEEAMPFFKEHLLELFNNVTKAYTSFYSATQENTQATEQHQKDLRVQFKILKEELLSLADYQRREREITQVEMDKFRYSMLNLFGELKQQGDDGMTRLGSSLSIVNDNLEAFSMQALARAKEEFHILSSISENWEQFQNAFLAGIHEIGSTIEELANKVQESESKQLALQDSLKNNLDLSSEFHHRVRSMEFELVEHLEAKSTLIEHKLGFLLDSVESLFNKSMLMVEKGHAEMMDSVQDVNTLLQEQKAALIETFSYLNDQSTKLLTLWNLIRPIFKAVGFANVLTFIWYFDDAVCGYIATTHSDIFNYTNTLFRKKTIVVSLRGTRSLSDVLTDLRVDMVPFKQVHHRLPRCGEKCKVHKGFAAYFDNTLAAIEDTLVAELDNARSSEDYELVVVGHSMGGSVAILLALHFLGLGYEKLTLVTMGQPLVGNSEFTTWADFVLGSYLPMEHGSFERKYLRVIHKGDLVTQVPSTSRNFLDKYAQFQNQVYLNVTGGETNPKPEEVVDCFSETNPLCIANDFKTWGSVDSALDGAENYRNLSDCLVSDFEYQVHAVQTYVYSVSYLI
ncbi:hypothetical protein ACQ2H7_001670 [Candidozyma auris]